MKNKKLIIISIIAVIGIIGAALATSYALFNINVTKDKINKIVMGNLELSINDSNNTFTDGKIVVNNMVPMKDATGMAQDGYSFTLTNTGSIDAGYSIFIDDVVVANLPSGITGRLDNSKVRVNLTNITTNTSNTYTLSSLTDRKLETGTLDAGTANSYVLRIWLDYTAGNESQNKYFAAKLRIDSVQKNSIPYKIVSGNLDTVGSVVQIVDEQFYVIGKEDNNHVKLLTKYNLGVGTGFDIPTNRQESTVTGINNAIIFADTYYWENSNEIEFPKYVYNENSNLKQYVDDYVDYLNNNGVSVTGRLISYEEIVSLGCDYQTSCPLDWIDNISYWTGTASEHYNIYVIKSQNGWLQDDDAVDNLGYGVRPVIILEI